MLKRVFNSTFITIFVLFAICLFSITGAIIIYLNPEGYYKIHNYPLFFWLSEHIRLDTFWIYINIFLFGYIGISLLFCLSNDIKRRNLFVAIMHITVAFFLIAHLIASVKTFRINDIILVENEDKIVNIKDGFPNLKLKLKSLSYNISQYGIPLNISATIELPDKTIKELKINHPIKVDKYHVLIKDITAMLKSIEVILTDENGIERITLEPDTYINVHNYSWRIIDANHDFSAIKVVIEDSKSSMITILKNGDYLTLNNKKFLIKAITPSFTQAVIVDIVYDPSINTIFYASTFFTLALFLQALLRLRYMFV